MDFVVHLIIAALFAGLGVMFFRGKGAGLVAGYNTAAPQEKAATDEKKLCRYMGKLMFALAGCFLVVAAGALFGSKTVFWLGFALFLIVAVVGAILANTRDRFRKDPER